jgi:uncharacterized protein (DUF736 family)
MNIGTFTKNEAGEIVGQISTFGAQFDGVAFERIAKSGNGPDYVVTTDQGELGAAWEKTSEKGNKYLSVSLKGPFLDKPVNAALLESTKEPGTFALVWNEPKKD